MEFRFHLASVEDIAPFLSPEGHGKLSWYGLTDGWFWIEVGCEELFRYSEVALDYWKRYEPDYNASTLPYTNYYVARYWEDLLDRLPAILEPLPDDFAARVADVQQWQAWQNQARRRQEESDIDEPLWDTYHAAVAWWGQRTWDAGHLAHPPRIWLWRADDTVHIRWNNRAEPLDGIPVWEADAGECALPVSEFLVAIESFNDRFLAEMGHRSDAAAANWLRPDVELDAPALLRAQAERSGWLRQAVAPQTAALRRDFSWEEVRAAMAVVETDFR